MLYVKSVWVDLNLGWLGYDWILWMLYYCKVYIIVDIRSEVKNVILFI